MICHDGVQRFLAPKATQDVGPIEPQVSDIALQTDSCNTLHVNKDMLVAYTIAVVQNTQSLQYEQMQITLQTVQNQASIETPLQAEQLMNAHFNLAILMDDPRLQ